MTPFAGRRCLVVILPVLFAAALDLEFVTMLAFAWEGLLSHTLPTVVTMLRGTKRRAALQPSAKERCYENDPWILRQLVRHLERGLRKNTVHANSTPVREVDFSNTKSRTRACRDTLSSTQGGRLSPFVVRSRKQFREFAPAWLLEHFGNYSVTAIDMKAFDDSIPDISRCPYQRKDLTQKVLLRDMALQPQFYANFNEDTLQHIYSNMTVDSDYFRFVDRQLHHMCDAFHGMDGELFFGWTSPDTAVSGTGFHCAIMENVFLQVHGERNWTLVDPRYTMRMRPMHEARYLQGAGLYDRGWKTLRRPAHWDSIPKMTVITKPGDMLFIPAWWWHEVRVGGGVFSLGISNRNYLTAHSWRHFPILRFVPGVLSKPPGVGLMPLLLDAIHYVPDLFGMMLVRLGILSPRRLIHILLNGNVQTTQLGTEMEK